MITDPPQLINHPKSSLQQLFNRNSIGITILQMAPSIFLNLGVSNIENIICDESSTLRVLALGGEHITNIKFLLNLMKNNTILQIFNLYGITEVSCWASVYEVHKNYDENVLIFQYGIPLGDPLNGTDLFVNNQEDSLEGRGDGELFIGELNFLNKVIQLITTRLQQMIDSVKIMVISQYIYSPGKRSFLITGC